MPRIDRTDGLFYSIVECHETGMLGVGRLIERVVARDPGIIFIVLEKRGRRAGDKSVKGIRGTVRQPR